MSTSESSRTATSLFFRTIPRIKETLQLNVELASPVDFITVRPDWQERSLFVAQEGNVGFFHFDLYAQALAKIERGHQQDVEDVREMLLRVLISRADLWDYFSLIESQLFRLHRRSIRRLSAVG